MRWDWFHQFCGSGPDKWVKPRRASDPLNSSYTRQYVTWATPAGQTRSCSCCCVTDTGQNEAVVMSLGGLWSWGRGQLVIICSCQKRNELLLLFPWSCSSEPLSVCGWSHLSVRPLPPRSVKRVTEQRQQRNSRSDCVCVCLRVRDFQRKRISSDSSVADALSQNSSKTNLCR